MVGSSNKELLAHDHPRSHTAHHPHNLANQDSCAHCWSRKHLWSVSLPGHTVGRGSGPCAPHCVDCSQRRGATDHGCATAANRARIQVLLAGISAGTQRWAHLTIRIRHRVHFVGAFRPRNLASVATLQDRTLGRIGQHSACVISFGKRLLYQTSTVDLSALRSVLSWILGQALDAAALRVLRAPTLVRGSEQLTWASVKFASCSQAFDSFSHSPIAAPTCSSLPAKKWSTPSMMTSRFGSGIAANKASTFAREPN
jgi:hypothetical protein